MSEAGQLVGRYIVEATLGRGAMGVVYRAHDPAIDRPVALKLVHADLLDGDERDAFVTRFQREAQAAGRCAHPNVVAVYDFALHEGNPFLAMEFVDGTSLSARSKGERMAPPEAVAIVLQVLAGLGAAHATGITHRDIKPANIMLARDGTVKVADFGISRIESSSLTTDGMIVGTPSYMSPEQCRGAAVDGRSDLFSTGVMLFELLAGSRPFAGSSAGALYMRLLHEDAPDIRTIRRDIPAALAAAIGRSLARDRDARFPTAAAMASALSDSLRGLASDDQTVVMSGGFERDVVDTFERTLVEHVGPIARYLVESAARQASDVDTLCATLAARIERPADRDKFTRDIRARLQIAPSALTTASLNAAETELLQSALTRYLGPVSRVLIKRAVPNASSIPALWQALALHIEQPADRAAFLKSAPPES